MIGYIKAAKIVLILLWFGISYYKTYQYGYDKAYSKYQASLVEQIHKNEEETTKSTQLAQSIDQLKNESIEKINKLESNNRALLLNTGVRKRKVCKGVPQNSSAGLSTDSTTASEFSTEFTEFLLSESKRGDELGIYAALAHNFTKELCRQENVVCPNEH